jgi:hypothetical protein
MRIAAVEWQFAITAVLVLAAASFVVRAILRLLFGRAKAGCGSACGKCATPEPPPPPGRIGLPQLPP